MSYEVQYKDKTYTLTGFVVVLPFSFDSSSRLKLQPCQATTILGFSFEASEDAEYPIFSRDLEGTSDRFELRDEHGITKITLHDHAPSRILSSQSTDLGRSTWIVRGTESEGCKIEFTGDLAERYQRFNKNAKRRFYWGGELKEQNTSLLKASYVDFDYDLIDKYVSRCLMFGPSGFGDGSIMNWIIEKGKWQRRGSKGAEAQSSQVLDGLTLTDLRRKTSFTLFGTDDSGKGQVVKDKKNSKTGGAVFLFQGSYSQLLPSHLAQITQLSASMDGHLQISALEALRTIAAQKCVDTVQEYNSEDDEGGDGRVFEGMCLWHLDDREDEQTPPIPIFL